MKIPEKYSKLFIPPVQITYADQDRLTPHLGHWVKLNSVLPLGFPKEDLEKLITLEMMGKQRANILNRLLSLWAKSCRTEVGDRLQKALR